MMEHNPHSESRFAPSGGGWHSTDTSPFQEIRVLMGGRHAAPAAWLVRNVISA
jgi:hypothetical protein